MLLVGCAKSGLLKSKLDGLNYQSVNFKVIKVVGLSLTVSHDAKDDKTAKSLVKQFVAAMPEMKNIYLSVQIVDEQGRVL
ncbi:MAG: hypothetical protein PWQ55_1170 [Chloroflexota bacterium]|nr:hypothetical protein [Chloroflexota bacterium]